MKIGWCTARLPGGAQLSVGDLSVRSKVWSVTDWVTDFNTPGFIEPSLQGIMLAEGDGAVPVDNHDVRIYFYYYIYSGPFVYRCI